MCEYKYGNVFRVRINGYVVVRFFFIFMSLDYILFELFKNVMRWVGCICGKEVDRNFGVRLLRSLFIGFFFLYRVTMESYLDISYNVLDVVIIIVNNDIDFVIRFVLSGS